MASAPPQQEPPRAPSATALDNLQAMMNLVLVSSGRFLKEQQAGASNGRLQFALTRAVPAATERFHVSLDELENEIRLAQTVLRRDLALLQADRRRKREEAAEAERQRLAAETSKKNEAVKKEEPEVDAHAAPARSTTIAGHQPSQSDAGPPSLNRDADDFPPPINTSAATAHDPLFDGTPTTANAQDTEFDFDAMFGDSVLDAANDTSNNQGDIDMDAAGPDLNFTLDDSGPSLLRGLEDFAKSGDDAGAQSNTNMDIDFQMPGLEDMNATTSTEQPNTTKPPDSTTEQQPTTDTAEDSTLLDTMMTDNLDDLFDLDGNPEATQFDDAFFGFGET